MVEVAGMPILEHQVRQLKQAGVSDIVIMEGFKASMIQDYFGDGSRWGLTIHHLVEQEGVNLGSFGSAGIIRQALATIPETESDVVIMYGYIISEFDIEALVRTHEESGRPMTLNLTYYTVPLGVVDINQEGVVTAFREKPRLFVSTGICVVKREILGKLPEKGDFFADVPQGFAEDITPYISDAQWWHITNGDDLRRADQELRERRLNVEGDSARRTERM